MIRVHVVTLFPEYFSGTLGCGTLRIAQSSGQMHVDTVTPRDHAGAPHRTVDDYPFGGGTGMVLRPEPLHKVLAAVRTPLSHTVLLTPRGTTFCQSMAERYSHLEHLILVCGRYKGVDERIGSECNEEVSLGDFVLGGGEAAAAAIIETVARLLPGVVGDSESVDTDSYTCGLLDSPYYTRPAEFGGERVPDELVSGDHAAVVGWRRRHSLLATALRRPSLLRRAVLTEAERTSLCTELQKEQLDG